MSVWFQDPNLDQLNRMCEKTMVSHCDIKLTKVTENELHGSMVVSQNIKQPFGIVHGGANCVLAETLGSIAANLTCDPATHHGVGLTITTNHLKAVRNGLITGVASPVHTGKKIQVWKIDTFNEMNQLTSQTNLTLSIIEKLGQ